MGIFLKNRDVKRPAKLFCESKFPNWKRHHHAGKPFDEIEVSEVFEGCADNPFDVTPDDDYLDEYEYEPEFDYDPASEGGNPPPKRKRGSYNFTADPEDDADDKNSKEKAAMPVGYPVQTGKYKLTAKISKDHQHLLLTHVEMNETTIAQVIEGLIAKHLSIQPRKVKS